jgi:hypothetical protein
MSDSSSRPRADCISVGLMGHGAAGKILAKGH